MLLSGVEKLGHAVALVDEESDRLIWCSASWKARMPRLCGSELQDEPSWSRMVSRLPELAGIFEQARADSTASGRVNDEGNGSPACLDIRKLDQSHFILQLHENMSSVDDMRQYMQARELLFTTSRTISVSEMATTLAHEIRQPIATITNILRGVRMRLSRGEASSVKIEEALDKALGQAQFTNSIISRIRDFTDARRPKQQSVEICELLHESLVLMDWLISNSHCRLALDLPQEPLHCDGDRTMLQQVLVNLLRNGVEAMQEREPSTRLISVSAKVHGESVRIGIHDHGHGLEGKEDTLFVPFATSKSNGMGVGLNICRSFVELHQGRLWLAPNEDGGCTSFVELPLGVLPHDEIIEDRHDG